MTIEFIIEDLPKLPNQTMYSHWRVKHAEAKKWKGLVCNAVLNARFCAAQPFPRATLTLTRYSTRKPDQDNLTFSFKHVVDGLKVAGVIVDDNQDAIRATYLWEKASPKKGKIKVKVESMEAA